jgi:hypothetical protein
LAWREAKLRKKSTVKRSDPLITMSAISATMTSRASDQAEDAHRLEDVVLQLARAITARICSVSGKRFHQ